MEKLRKPEDYIYDSKSIQSQMTRALSEDVMSRALQRELNFEEMSRTLARYIIRERTENKPPKITITEKEFNEHFHVRRPRKTGLFIEDEE